jgi:Flp pilus assembly protein TadG
MGKRQWSGNKGGAVSRLNPRRTGTRREEGAALFEFALLMPILVILLLGIIEFGWLFAQMNEIRHVAQEGARWGAVSHPDVNSVGSENWGDIGARACGAANLPGGSTVTVTGSAGSGVKGGTASITVTANTQSLSSLGLIEAFLPSSLSNTATFRLEQDAKWAGSSTTC